MKKEQFGQLAAEVIENLKANKVTVKPCDNPDHWAEFRPLTTDENKDANDKGLYVTGTLFKSGMVQICITCTCGEDAMADAFKNLKARAIVAEAVERKIESEQNATEADKLLTKAAGILGIPVADVEKIVVTETED